MDFLKEILGEELFAQVKEKIDAHNGDEANKDKQIKIGNLGSGEYVGKGKYDALQEAMTGKDTEITNANNLIAELKKASKGNEDMQKKFTEYEAENAKLQAELAETKMKAALKVALMTGGAVDVDYLAFKLKEKLKEKGEALEVDENDNIKGWTDKLSGLKVQFPTMFRSASSEGDKKILENKLQHGTNEQTVTKEQFQKMGIEERSKFKAENESLYKQYTGKQ